MHNIIIGADVVPVEKNIKYKYEFAGLIMHAEHLEAVHGVGPHTGNFIAPAIISLKKAIKAEFDTFIGIPNTNTDKKERLLVDEINGNNVDTMSKAALWIDTLNEGVDRCIELFPELKGKLTHFRFRVTPTDVNGNYIYGGGLNATRNNTVVDDKLES